MSNISEKVLGTVLASGLLLGATETNAENTAAQYRLPAGFVYLDEIDNTIQQDLKYVGTDNFIGVPITGYYGNRCILTRQAAEALAKIQRDLKPLGLGLLVFDGYRPQQAVDHFVRWSEDVNDQRNKPQFYPRVDKKDVFKLGYVARRSGHTRGSTVDLTIINTKTGLSLDMGTPFDFMDELSHPANKNVTKTQYQHRVLLREAMEKQGFAGITTEWWHFTLMNEPFKDTYFDFAVR